MINKCCVVVCENSYDQAVFIRAIRDVSPDTICFPVKDPADALFIISNESLTPNVIFIEYQMHGMDAIEFLQIGRGMEELKNTSIIVHAPTVKSHTLLELKALGALAIYQRPHEYNSVCNMLSIFLEDELGITILN